MRPGQALGISGYNESGKFEEVVAYIHKESTHGLHEDVGSYLKDFQ